MKSKFFILTFTLIVVGIMFFSVLIVYTIDPFFHYHMPWFGLEPVVYSEIYQNPGLADHAEYDSIIIGNSFSENFDAKWFNEGFGINAIKLTYSGGTFINLKTSIERAEAKTNFKLKYVFSNIDLYNIDQYTMSGRPDDEPRFPLPEYLYNKYLYDDVYYLLNKDVVFDDVLEVIKSNYGNAVTPMSQAYQWYTNAEFSKENAMKDLELPEKFETVEQKTAIISDNSIGIINRIKELINTYPETTFCFYYSPNSMVEWYSYYEKGELLSRIATLEYSMEQLLECDNVQLYFPATYEMIIDLDSYKDATHYDMKIQYQIFKDICNGDNQLTKDNYKRYIQDFKNMILECDFEEVFK